MTKTCNIRDSYKLSKNTDQIPAPLVFLKVLPKLTGGGDIFNFFSMPNIKIMCIENNLGPLLIRNRGDRGFFANLSDCRLLYLINTFSFRSLLVLLTSPSVKLKTCWRSIFLFKNFAKEEALRYLEEAYTYFSFHHKWVQT
jgi:hypothetical protein